MALEPAFGAWDCWQVQTIELRELLKQMTVAAAAAVADIGIVINEQRFLVETSSPGTGKPIRS